MPKFSVIVPVYNALRYLSECLNSLATQTLEDYEIILVDDGSTDGSGEACDRFAASQGNALVIHQENAGVSAARNAGIQAARGTYLCFVDADDQVSPHMLERAGACIGAADLLLCGYTRSAKTPLTAKSPFDAFETLTPGLRQILVDKTIYDDGMCLNQVNASTVWAKFYKTALLKKHKIAFPIGIRIAEDKLFNFTFFRNCKKVRVIPDILYHCRTHSGSVTQSYMDGCYAVCEKTFRLYRAQISRMKNPAVKARYETLLALRIVPVMRSSLALDICCRSNPKPYKARREDFLQATGSRLFRQLWKTCDKKRLNQPDRFTYHLLTKSFWWINLVMRHRYLRGALMILLKPFL